VRQVRRGYGGLLESKAERWAAQQAALVESIQDLAAFYAALRALPRATSTADLGDWFARLVQQVGLLIDNPKY
jgi:hypothetical protein